MDEKPCSPQAIQLDERVGPTPFVTATNGSHATALQAEYYCSSWQEERRRYDGNLLPYNSIWEYTVGLRR